ncbi:MAG: NAD-dependent epimerase/dehydratase family protein, partial [Xanthobacteraceae bacterium]|nr:NAD-dependent epimerase/dehydratase family protein [Xanthobacteraceae bacterium]
TYLSRDIELIVGDVRNPTALETALRGVDSVIHLAAAVGVGQSMYEIASYTANNDLGTAVLLEALARHPVGRLVCASSMSIYGEGLAQTDDGQMVEPEERRLEQLRRGEWELRDTAGNPLTPLPTPESKRPSLNSVYALNKFVQERLCLVLGGVYDIPTVALRFFNVYGPRQALSNPYTGVLAIFAAQLLNGRAPVVFEDGEQRRDFVHVRDVAHACVLALNTSSGLGKAFNIGSGQSRTIRSIAEALARVMAARGLEPNITGKYRAGDIRHCFADVSRSRSELGFEPKVRFEDGLAELAEWLSGEIAEDRTEKATAELASRGLVA